LERGRKSLVVKTFPRPKEKWEMKMAAQQAGLRKEGWLNVGRGGASRKPVDSGRKGGETWGHRGDLSLRKEGD